MPIDDVEGQACAKCACLAKSPSGLNNSVLRIVFLCGAGLFVAGFRGWLGY